MASIKTVRSYCYSASSPGFTLVELAVVIMVIGLVAAFSSARFINKAEFDTFAFHQDVLSSVRFAQKLAVTTGCDVQFNIVGNQYTLTQRDSCNPSNNFTQGVINPGNGQAPFSITAPSSVTVFSSDNNPFYFSSKGQSFDNLNANTDVVITVGSKTINIVGVTGYVYDSTT